jgi:hypothetical protein
MEHGLQIVSGIEFYCGCRPGEAILTHNFGVSVDDGSAVIVVRCPHCDALGRAVFV